MSLSISVGDSIYWKPKTAKINRYYDTVQSIEPDWFGFRRVVRLSLHGWLVPLEECHLVTSKKVENHAYSYSSHC